eukprot:1657960-Amphidinium_carterae.1
MRVQKHVAFDHKHQSRNLDIFVKDCDALSVATNCRISNHTHDTAQGHRIAAGIAQGRLDSNHVCVACSVSGTALAGMKAAHRAVLTTEVRVQFRGSLWAPGCSYKETGQC